MIRITGSVGERSARNMTGTGIEAVVQVWETLMTRVTPGRENGASSCVIITIISITTTTVGFDMTNGTVLVVQVHRGTLRAQMTRTTPEIVKRGSIYATAMTTTVMVMDIGAMVVLKILEVEGAMSSRIDDIVESITDTTVMMTPRSRVIENLILGSRIEIRVKVMLKIPLRSLITLIFGALFSEIN